MRTGSSWHRLLPIALVLLGTVGCDQGTKQLAIAQLRGEPGHVLLGGLVRLGYAENPGAFLSLFGGLPRVAQFWVLTAGVGAGLVALLAYLVASRQLERVQTVALALLVGGGVSNWLDRVTNDGRVVDFVTVGLGRVRTGVFNVADVAIMLGVLLMVWPVRAQRGSPPPVGEG